MMRKFILAFVAAAAIGAVTLASTAASAGHWRSHGYGGHGPGHGLHRGHGHFNGFHGHRAHRFHGFPGCWRWIPTRYGLVKGWVC